MNDRQENDRNNNNGFICGVVEGFYGKPWNCEQRKDLFKRLRGLNLNAFMYAPKDDTKHRAKWRQFYSDIEANELKILIDEAKANGINFYYSLAPGLDMIYSDRGELDLLVKKYDQLVELGCESFAILFDDIEPTINEKDKKVFKNYALAQISVTNMIFEHLNRPKFLFCPTEYCESRAVPNVTNSCYLNTLGTGLLGGIDIMWSGSRVISKLITEESIETLTKVIRRPPVIWENLHANDYDKKRIFLGPYSGRSTKIIPKLRGVLTNPNCEYEANYIAIHTLAQWSKCTEDADLHNRFNLNEQQFLAKNGTSFEQTRLLVYDPNRALAFAIKDWLPRILENRSIPSGMATHSNIHHSEESASNQISKEADHEVKDIDVEESNVDMVPDETQSSAASNSTNKSDMDTSCSPITQTNLIDTNSCDSCDMVDATVVADSANKVNTSIEEVHKLKSSTCVDCIMCSVGGKAPKTFVNQLDEGRWCEAINFDNLSLLVDLFYLPFEHGSYGYTLLKDIKWLRDNSDILISENLQDQQEEESQMYDNGDQNTTTNSCSDITIRLWIERAEKLNNLCTCISRLVNTLIYDCPNKLVIIELYPYLADMRDVASMIIDYIKFLRYRTSTLARFYYSTNNSSKYKESASSDDQEPWVHRGGLIGDVQRLLS